MRPPEEIAQLIERLRSARYPSKQDQDAADLIEALTAERTATGGGKQTASDAEVLAHAAGYAKALDDCDRADAAALIRERDILRVDLAIERARRLTAERERDEARAHVAVVSEKLKAVRPVSEIVASLRQTASIWEHRRNGNHPIGRDARDAADLIERLSAAPTLPAPDKAQEEVALSIVNQWMKATPLMLALEPRFALRDAIAAALSAAHASGREEGERASADDTIDYEIWQVDMPVASSSDLTDALHYVSVYSQDGPVKLVKATTRRTEIALPVPSPAQASTDKGEG